MTITVNTRVNGRVFSTNEFSAQDGDTINLELSGSIGIAKQQRDTLARWIVMHGNPLGDHACAQCHPRSDILVHGFVCAYHLAEKIAKHYAQPNVKHLPADDTEGGAA